VAKRPTAEDVLVNGADPEDSAMDNTPALPGSLFTINEEVLRNPPLLASDLEDVIPITKEEKKRIKEALVSAGMKALLNNDDRLQALRKAILSAKEVGSHNLVESLQKAGVSFEQLTRVMAAYGHAISPAKFPARPDVGALPSDCWVEGQKLAWINDKGAPAVFELKPGRVWVDGEILYYVDANEEVREVRGSSFLDDEL